MNTPSDAVPESAVQSREIAPAAVLRTRPMYWSILRELWENRSLYVAPLVMAGFVMFVFTVSTVHLPRKFRALSALDPAKQREALSQPYDSIAGILIVTAGLVGFFYCLDALYGERRDRSILFWKSLPVSDRTIVLSKAAIPLVVLPLFVFAIVVVAQRLMLLVSTAVLGMNGMSASALWKQLPLFQMALAFLYALAAMALWHAPIYSFLLLVSVWARRAPFLWAVLPPLAISAAEAIAFRTHRFASLLQYRLVGWFPQAFVTPPKGSSSHPVEPLAALTPAKFLTTPGLWVGLAFAAVCLIATVRLRREREPI
jgi:ABC-2 type transport system permease protein